MRRLRKPTNSRNRRVTVISLPKAVTDRTHFTAHLVRHCSISKMRQLNGGRWRPRFPAPLRASEGAGVGWKIYGGAGGRITGFPPAREASQAGRAPPAGAWGLVPTNIFNNLSVQKTITNENQLRIGARGGALRIKTSNWGLVPTNTLNNLSVQ